MRASYMVLLVLAACRSHDETVPADEPPAATASAATKPVDHLAVGELLPGPDKAFALVLPRGFHVQARFPDSVVVDGEASAVDLARYVAARVKDGKANIQPAKVSFEEVRVPDDPGRLLTLRIDETVPGHCVVQVTDVTPPPDLGGDVATRMKRNGRTPDGKLEGRDKME